MWQSIISKAPEGISVDEFFTKFVPDQFSQMNELFSVMDFSFLTGRDFKMQSMPKILKTLLPSG